MSYDDDDPRRLRTANCLDRARPGAIAHCLRLIGLSHLPDFIKHLNKIAAHSLVSAAARPQAPGSQMALGSRRQVGN